MNATKNFSKKVGLFLKVLFLLPILFYGCTNEDIVPQNNNDNLKSQVLHEGTITLKGITGFGFYAAKEHNVLADPYENYLDCTAELTFGKKQNFVITTKEFFPGEETFYYRKVSFNGQITPSGQLKFSYPMTFTEFDFVLGDYVEKTVGILPEMKLHTGCVFYGAGINDNTLDYKGYFDGERLFADMHITGIQEVPGQMPFLENMVDGPIMINFLIDLKKTQ